MFINDLKKISKNKTKEIQKEIDNKINAAYAAIKEKCYENAKIGQWECSFNRSWDILDGMSDPEIDILLDKIEDIYIKEGFCVTRFNANPINHREDHVVLIISWYLSYKNLRSKS